MVARHQPSIGQGLWNHNDEIYWQRCTQLLTSTNFNHNIHFLPQTSWQFYPQNPRDKCISGVENKTTNKAEAYQTSKIEFFAKIVNGWKLKANFWRFLHTIITVKRYISEARRNLIIRQKISTTFHAFQNKYSSSLLVVTMANSAIWFVKKP